MFCPIRMSVFLCKILNFFVWQFFKFTFDLCNSMLFAYFLPTDFFIKPSSLNKIFLLINRPEQAKHFSLE